MMMSGGLLEYSGLVTKTRAMSGRLLEEEDYVKLSEYETVDAFIAFLREAEGYAPIFASHEEIAHRGQVEAVIRDSLYADYEKLYRFARGEQRKGLDIIFFRYEVNVLKSCLQYAMTGSEYEPGYLKLVFDGHACFDAVMAGQARSFSELLMAVAGTDYEKLLLRMSENGQMTYADYAFGLDVYYYTNAWKRIQKIHDAKVKRIMRILLGTEIDWQNIMWIYRSKRFYKMNPTDIYVNIIPVNYRLTKIQLRRMIEAETVEEFKEILKMTSYFTEKEAIVKLGDEITSRRIMEKTYRLVYRKYPMSLAPVLRYLYDKEHEIDLLTSVLEGIRYRIPSREIKELVLIM